MPKGSDDELDELEDEFSSSDTDWDEDEEPDLSDTVSSALRVLHLFNQNYRADWEEATLITKFKKECQAALLTVLAYCTDPAVVEAPTDLFRSISNRLQRWGYFLEGQERRTEQEAAQQQSYPFLPAILLTLWDDQIESYSKARKVHEPEYERTQCIQDFYLELEHCRFGSDGYEHFQQAVCIYEQLEQLAAKSQAAYSITLEYAYFRIKTYLDYVQTNADLAPDWSPYYDHLLLLRQALRNANPEFETVNTDISKLLEASELKQSLQLIAQFDKDSELQTVAIYSTLHEDQFIEAMHRIMVQYASLLASVESLDRRAAKRDDSIRAINALDLDALKSFRLGAQQFNPQEAKARLKHYEQVVAPAFAALSLVSELDRDLAERPLSILMLDAQCAALKKAFAAGPELTTRDNQFALEQFESLQKKHIQLKMAPQIKPPAPPSHQKPHSVSVAARASLWATQKQGGRGVAAPAVTIQPP